MTLATALESPALRTSCCIVSMCEGGRSLGRDGTSTCEAEQQVPYLRKFEWFVDQQGQKIGEPRFLTHNGATRISKSPVESRTLDNACRRRANGGNSQAKIWSQGC